MGVDAHAGEDGPEEDGELDEDEHQPGGEEQQVVVAVPVLQAVPAALGKFERSRESFCFWRKSMLVGVYASDRCCPALNAT